MFTFEHDTVYSHYSSKYIFVRMPSASLSNIRRLLLSVLPSMVTSVYSPEAFL